MGTLHKVRLWKRWVVHHRVTQWAAAASVLVAIYLAFVWAPPIYAPMQSQFQTGESYFAAGTETLQLDGETVSGPASFSVESITETGSAYVIEGATSAGAAVEMTIDKSLVNQVVEKGEGASGLEKLVVNHRVHQGSSWRIFYFHVGIAWVMALAFFHTFVASLGYLRTEQERFDVTAKASAEVGWLFALLVLVTGSIWARPAWGTWWDWDPRLTTSLVLWLIYGGYLALRGEGMERQAAVYGVLAFATVPITFVSIRLWRTVHPTPIKTTGVDIGGPVVAAMLVGLLAMTLLYVHLTTLRVKVEMASRRMRDVKRSMK